MHNCMYVGHLGIYNAGLVKSLGGFRSEYDFSQDYDLMLRVSEATNKISHIRRVLYGWRMISTSASSGGKPYARNSNIKALLSHINKIYPSADVIPLPTANCINFNSTQKSDVAVIVPSDDEDNISATIESISRWPSRHSIKIYVVTNSKIIKNYHLLTRLATLILWPMINPTIFLINAIWEHQLPKKRY